MKKLFYLSFLTIIFSSCNKTSPEKYFDVAVLNCNKLHGFANEGLLRQLESPSLKLTDVKDVYDTATRKETLETEIRFVEENFSKLKSLEKTDETKEMIDASVALYEFVLPVYKNEYSQLASLFDNKSDKPSIQALAASIEKRYAGKFSLLYNNVLTSGKAYAEKNHIKVQWGIQTSPM